MIIRRVGRCTISLMPTSAGSKLSQARASTKQLPTTLWAWPSISTITALTPAFWILRAVSSGISLPCSMITSPVVGSMMSSAAA